MLENRDSLYGLKCKIQKPLKARVRTRRSVKFH